MATSTSRPPLAQKIRSARKAAGYSQEAFAVALGTSRRHVIKWEKGQHAPSPDYLARIAEATGTTAAELNGDDEDDEEDAALHDLAQSLHRILRAELRRIRKGVAAGDRA